jgi:hypothetical protein
MIEIFILFVGVVVPLMAIGFFAMYKEKHEERKEKTTQPA